MNIGPARRASLFFLACGSVCTFFVVRTHGKINQIVLPLFFLLGILPPWRDFAQDQD